ALLCHIEPVVELGRGRDGQTRDQVVAVEGEQVHAAWRRRTPAHGNGPSLEDRDIRRNRQREPPASGPESPRDEWRGGPAQEGQMPAQRGQGLLCFGEQ